MACSKNPGAPTAVTLRKLSGLSVSEGHVIHLV